MRREDDQDLSNDETDPVDDSSESTQGERFLKADNASDTTDGSSDESPLDPESPQDDSSTATEPQAESDSESHGGDDVQDSESDDGDDDLPEYEPLTPELVAEEAERGDFMLRWAVVLLAVLLGCYGVYQSTTLLRTASGQYMASHGLLPPATDVFSLTATDRAWVNLGWGTDLVLAGLYALPGQDICLTLFAAAVAGLTLGLLVHISRPGLPNWWTSVLATVALLAAFPQFVAGPESITLLGLAVQLWLLHRFGLTGRPRDLWALVGVQLLWVNLDPRAWIGLLVLVLYGLGEWLGARQDRPGLGGPQQRKLYWQVTLGVGLACLLNPFHIHSLLAPLALYGTEYPALRAYNVLLLDQSVSMDRLQYYPLTAIVYHQGHWFNWSWLNFHVIAGVLVLVAAGVTLFLNRRRADSGHVAVLLGLTLLSLMGVRELAPAALVAAVLAGLNAQDWYRVTFPQEYTVEPRELLFSRGGRALTVLAFFAVALLGILGWLTPENGRKLGLGLDARLAAAVDGLRTDLNERLFTLSGGLAEDLDRGRINSTLRKQFTANKIVLPDDASLSTRQPGSTWSIRSEQPGHDYLVVQAVGRLVVYRDLGRDDTHRGFNFVPGQGDLMIWIGHRPFIDNRVRLYADSGDSDLLTLHRRTRAALRLRTLVIGTDEGRQVLRVQVASETFDSIEVIHPPGGPGTRETIETSDLDATASTPASRGEMPQTGVISVWRTTFDTHRITHVLPRLHGPARPDYTSMFDLIQYPNHWQLVRIGATTAVFYRKADAQESIIGFLEKHTNDFAKSAFRTPAEKLDPRPELARGDTSYTSRFAQKRNIPVPAIARATHLARILKMQQSSSGFMQALQEVALRVTNQDLTGGPSSQRALSVLGDTAAVAHVTIRSANEGLATAPNSSEGFLVLGIAYACLDDIELAFRGGDTSTPWAKRRYFESILALNQAIELDKDNAEALFTRYQRLQRLSRVDLALESLKRFDELTRLPKGASEAQIEARRQQIDDPLQRLISNVEPVKKEIQKRFHPEDGTDPPNRVEYALALTREQPGRNVFIGEALKLINDDVQKAANPEVLLLKAQWMMEAGIFKDEATAMTLDEMFQDLGEQSGQSASRTTLAISRLAYADFDQANQLWQGELARLEQQLLGDALRHLPLVLRPQQWPFDQLNSTMNLVLLHPSMRSELLFNVAMSHLEAGRVNQAGDELTRMIDEVPDSHLRPLAQFYISQITNKPLELRDSVGPLQMIPVEAEMFGSEPKAAPKSE